MCSPSPDARFASSSPSNFNIRSRTPPLHLAAPHGFPMLSSRHSTGRRTASHGPGWLRLGVRLLLFACLASGARGADATNEYAIKAAFLYNFTKFIEWPAGHFAAETSPIVIGVLGRNPFGSDLENIVRNRKVNGHPLVVRSIESVATKTDILFIPADEESRLQETTLASLQTEATVTVGETPQFLNLGGTIAFTLSGGKIRFEINQAAADQAGTRVSAHLLQLAVTVRKGHAGAKK